MIEHNIPLFENIPQDNPDGKKDERPKRYRNCLADIFHELISERKISLAKVHKETGIPFPTLDDWIKGTSKSQLTDDNLMILARYLNVGLEYLCYGLGDDEDFLESEDDPKVARVAEHFKIERKVALAIINGEKE